MRYTYGKGLFCLKLFLKILKRIVITLLILCLVGYSAYQIAYPYIAPMVFDYLVERNAQMFVELEESLEATLEPDITEELQTPSPAVDTENPEDSSEASRGSETEQTPVATPPKKKPNTEIQTVHTTMGDFTGFQLVRALKNISPADKTRIISICQQAVSMSDIATVTQILTRDGLTVDQQKYIENYLRNNLSVPSKREILEILQKY